FLGNDGVTQWCTGNDRVKLIANPPAAAILGSRQLPCRSGLRRCLFHAHLHIPPNFGRLSRIARPAACASTSSPPAGGGTFLRATPSDVPCSVRVVRSDVARAH